MHSSTGSRAQRRLWSATVLALALVCSAFGELHDTHSDDSSLPSLAEATDGSPLTRFKLPDSWSTIEENDFTNPSSWKVFNLERARGFTSSKMLKTTAFSPDGNPHTALGFRGALVTPDGRYIVFIPHGGGTGSPKHGNAVMYDTQGDFDRGKSWRFVNVGAVGGLKNTTGYMGGTLLGDFMYFAPLHDGKEYHAKVIRYNWKLRFNASSSWEAFDASGIDGLKTVGYCGAVSAQTYVYFVPCSNEFTARGFHSELLRYDTSKPFAERSSWAAFDISSVIPSVSGMGFHGASFVEPYIYFVPFRGGVSSSHGIVVRYDIRRDLKDSGAWDSYDAGSTDGMNTRGYAGSVVVGPHLYFVPQEDEYVSHGRILRYDLRKNFKAKSSWEAFDAGTLPYTSQGARGFHYATSWGPYIYFSPHYDISASPIAVRYDSRKPFTSADSYTKFDLSTLQVYGNKDLVDFSGAVTVGSRIFFVPGRFRFVPCLNLSTELPEK